MKLGEKLQVLPKFWRTVCELRKVQVRVHLVLDMLLDNISLIVDNHTVLGKTPLIKTLSSLFTLARHGSAIPDSKYTTPILEILRVSANLCMDHGQLQLPWFSGAFRLTLC